MGKPTEIPRLSGGLRGGGGGRARAYASPAGLRGHGRRIHILVQLWWAGWRHACVPGRENDPCRSCGWVGCRTREKSCAASVMLPEAGNKGVHVRLTSAPTRDTALVTPMGAPARPRAHPFGATLCICMHRGRLGPAAGQRHAHMVVGRTLSNRVAGARVHTIVPGQSTAYKVCFGAVPADWGSARPGCAALAPCCRRRMVAGHRGVCGGFNIGVSRHSRSNIDTAVLNLHWRQLWRQRK